MEISVAMKAFLMNHWDSVSEYKAYYIKPPYTVGRPRTKTVNTRLYLRDNKEWPKFSLVGLGVHSEGLCRELAKLQIGESYSIYKRIR